MVWFLREMRELLDGAAVIGCVRRFGVNRLSIASRLVSIHE